MPKGIYRYINQCQRTGIVITWYIILVHDDGRQDETTGGTDFTISVCSTYNTCDSSVSGVILQDRDTPENLEQVSKFNSTNQNMCSDTGT